MILRGYLTAYHMVFTLFLKLHLSPFLVELLHRITICKTDSDVVDVEVKDAEVKVPCSRPFTVTITTSTTAPRPLSTLGKTHAPCR